MGFLCYPYIINGEYSVIGVTVIDWLCSGAAITVLVNRLSKQYSANKLCICLLQAQEGELLKMSDKSGCCCEENCIATPR